MMGGRGGIEESVVEAGIDLALDTGMVTAVVPPSDVAVNESSGWY